MSTWSCGTCTYINAVSRPTCEMCNTKKGGPAATPAAAPTSPTYGVPVVQAVPFAASWNCGACTYTNSGTRQKCEMCESPRNPVRQQASAASASPNKAPASLTPTKSQAELNTSPARKPHAAQVYCSWLKKKSPKAVLGRHIWEPRYFILFSDRLLYFRRYDESFDLTKFAGCIMLTDVDSVITLTHNSNSTRYRFNIQLSNSDKKFELMADGEEVDKGKKWNVMLLNMLPERGNEQKGVQGKFWKAGAETPPEVGTRRRASSIRRQNVYAGRSSFTGIGGADQKKEQMPQEDKDFVLLVITDTRVALKNLDAATKEKILASMFKKSFQTGQICVKAGEVSSLFFIVKTGSFSALKLSNRKQAYTSGTCFGEEDLLSEQPSTVTITAVEDSVCWCLDRTAYKSVLMASNLGRAAQYLAFLSANRLLSSLSESDLRQLAGALEEAEYGAGEEIVTQGEAGESFYIVKSGECEVMKDGVKVAHYWEGDSFGERALLQNANRAATVVAVTEVVVLQLDRSTFINLLGPLETIKTKQQKEEKPPELSTYAVGDRLEVQTAKGPQVGTVRYVGFPHFTKRGRLGVELDKPMGKHDGHSKGVRYFKCPNKHGVFVANDEVIRVVQKAPEVKPVPVQTKPATTTTAATTASASSASSAPKTGVGGARDRFEQMAAQNNPANTPAKSDQKSDGFAALAAKKNPSPTPNSSSQDAFSAIATKQPVPQPVQTRVRGLSDIFDSSIISSVIAPAQKQGPAILIPSSAAPNIQPPREIVTGDFLTRSNMGELDEKELKTSPRPSPAMAQQRTHFSDDEDDDEDKREQRGKAKAIGPGAAAGVDELLYNQLGLQQAQKTPDASTGAARKPEDSKAASPTPSPAPSASAPQAAPAPSSSGSSSSASSTSSSATTSSTAAADETARLAAHQQRLKEIREAQISAGVSCSMIDKPDRNHKPCRVDQMIEIGELGRGTFGTVKLMTDPNTQLTYALKTIDKSYLIKKNQVEFVKNERLCLSMMDNPFLVKMYAASMDAKSIFFVLEPAMGGELFALLNERERLPANDARFYGASIVMAFEYMHSIGVVYRDLKPENILLDDVGYVKLTDFGFAKQLGAAKTYTFCGTPDYISPEIVSNEGHSFGTDWWCLGILIYEMLTGNTPFFDEGGALAMYDKIVNAPVTFPDYVSEAARDLISGLLAKKESKRLGVVMGGATTIKQHPFFAGFDWDGLVNRTIPAPFLRPLKNKFDLSHFSEPPPKEENPEAESEPEPQFQVHN